MIAAFSESELIFIQINLSWLNEVQVNHSNLISLQITGQSLSEPVIPAGEFEWGVSISTFSLLWVEHFVWDMQNFDLYGSYNLHIYDIYFPLSDIV